MSNHLGDTNKMVGDTPRTDAAWKPDGGDGYPTVDVDLARQLERELNTANKRIKELEAKVDELHDLEKWLEGR
jgi:type II secretory pathway predicted ATPase ExeA